MTESNHRTRSRTGRFRTGFAGAMVALVACGEPSEPPAGAADPAEVGTGTQAPVRPEATTPWPPASDSISGTPWTRQDWDIFQAAVETARARGLDTLPLGEAVAEMGLLFLGTPYVPRTLEVPGPERLVVNFRALDCVTFVENVLALTRFSRVHGVEALQDPSRARALYEEDLASLRYREGRAEGYPSRLHYFSEWLAVNEEGGRLQLRTEELGGIPDPEPVSFMSGHPEAYDQLADPRALEGISAVEEVLNARGPRIFLPEERLAREAGGIRTGDVIAATSTVPGLDVAHTGLAIRVNGVLRLLHAPLVGSTVVLSERSLPERLRGISSQDGVMVARPGGSWFGETR